MADAANTFLLLVLAFFFPPAAVACVSGCGADLCFNILLTILGFLPGCIHALWLVLKRADANERYGYGNWTYVGMGEYAPVGAAPAGGGYPAPYGQVPPPTAAPAPVPGQYPAGKTPPPGQAPLDQKQGGYAPPPPPAPVPAPAPAPPPASPPAPAPAPAPPEQKYGAPIDQKAVVVVPGDQKPADPTAPSSGT